MPGGETYKAGDDEVRRQGRGIVQVKVNDKVVTEEVANIKLNDGDLVTIAFAPKGAELPAPPSASDLSRLDPRTDEVIPEGQTTPPAATDGNTTTVPATPRARARRRPTGRPTTTTSAP